MIVNNEYDDDDEIDDDDDDIDDVMKEGRLLIGQRGVSNSMLYPALPVIIIVIKVFSADFMNLVICSAVSFIFDIEIMLIILRKYCRPLPNKFFP